MGNKIKEIRKSKGITQKELAEKLGVTPQAVSQFERSDTKKFNVSTLQNIASALECSIRDLVDPDRVPAVNVRLELVKGSQDQKLFSYILLTIPELNHMGCDALTNYLELLLNSEKYTSINESYLRGVWGDDVYDKFYPEEEKIQFDVNVPAQTTDNHNKE